MSLQSLGYTEIIEAHRKAQQLDGFQVGRVISEHKERYSIQNDQGIFEGELMGNLRFSAESRHDFPAVGDWVAFSEYDADKALIHAIYPRSTVLERQAVGKFGQTQIIATNLDYGLIVQAVGRDFSLNRLERYLTICHGAGVLPMVVLNKIDLINEAELKELLATLAERLPEVPLLPLSSETQVGYEALRALIQPGKTYCLLGSSGVGKSTLLNRLAGTEAMKTGEISAVINRGKHVTTHRELVVLPTGGIFIDNPGMREVGIADRGEGLEMTFDVIQALAENCRFADCSHQQEKGCAVLQALEHGELDPGVYENYLKMGREKTRFESSVHEKRKKDKAQGKLYKRIQEDRRKRKS